MSAFERMVLRIAALECVAPHCEVTGRPIPADEVEAYRLEAGDPYAVPRVLEEVAEREVRREHGLVDHGDEAAL